MKREKKRKKEELNNGKAYLLAIYNNETYDSARRRSSFGEAIGRVGRGISKLLAENDKKHDEKLAVGKPELTELTTRLPEQAMGCIKIIQLTKNLTRVEYCYKLNSLAGINKQHEMFE